MLLGEELMDGGGDRVCGQLGGQLGGSVGVEEHGLGEHGAEVGGDHLAQRLRWWAVASGRPMAAIWTPALRRIANSWAV